MKTGEGKTLVSTLPVYLNALDGQRGPRGHGQRLPGHPGLRVDGRAPPVPGLDRGPGRPRHRRSRGQAGGLRRRHHLRHQHRVRLRLPARQHGPVQGRHGPARPRLRHRRRGRLHPHRRGPDAAHHLRARPPSRPSSTTSSPASPGPCGPRSTTRSTRRSGSSSRPRRASRRWSRQLGVENIYDAVSVNYVHQLTQALTAKELYRRDKDYLVAQGEVKIVDEFTGRTLDGRRWSDGLHQAVEAKERVAIKEENHTWATVTLQNYFRLYDKLSGMTGTAETEAGGVRQHLRPPGGAHPDQQGHASARTSPTSSSSPRRPSSTRWSRTSPSGTRRPAGAGRHGLGGQVRAAVPAAGEAGHPPRGPQRQAALPGGRDRGPGRPASAR